MYGIDKTWASDLVDIYHLSKYNKGYKYILTIIDVFKYSLTVPLKGKKKKSSG